MNKRLKSKALREIEKHPNWDESVRHDGDTYQLVYYDGMYAWQVAKNDTPVLCTLPDHKLGLFPDRRTALVYIETGEGGKLDEEPETPEKLRHLPDVDWHKSHRKLQQLQKVSKS